MIFLTTLQQVAILLIFILIGYFFRKKNVINDSGRKVLSGLLVNLFAPAYIINSLSTIINVDNISEYAMLFIAGTIVGIALIFIAIPLANMLGKDEFNKNLLKYAITFGNTGYFGYPLIYGVFGAVARAQMMLFCVPISIATYSYGYYILTKPVEGVLLNVKDSSCEKQRNLSYLYSAPILASYIGVALGLLTSGLGFQLPMIFTDLLETAGNCQSVLAMLITGAVLANVPFVKLFTSWKPYVVGLIRLLVMPVIFGGLFMAIYLCVWNNDMFMRIAFIAIVSVSMPVGMNVVVYPESVGKDGTEGAKMCFISYILALIALPTVYTVLLNLLNVTF